MKVNDLVAELLKLDQDSEIYIEDSGCGCCAGAPDTGIYIVPFKDEVWNSHIKDWEKFEGMKLTDRA